MSEIANQNSQMEYFYELTRKSKLYRRNTLFERIRFPQLQTLAAKAEVSFSGFSFRIFYYQFADSLIPDQPPRENLLKDYCDEFLTQVFNYQRSYNLRCTIHSVFDDTNLSIYDVILGAQYDTNTVFTFLRAMLSFNATQFCSRIELTIFDLAHSKHYQFYYNSTRYHLINPELHHLTQAVPLTASIDPLRVSPKKIDQWTTILEEHWDELHADIFDKALTVRAQSKYQSDLITRRYFDRQEIVFDNYLDLANAIYQYDIIELIPNCHTTDYVLTDVTVDFDPAKKMSYEDGKVLSDLFMEFLRNKKFTTNVHLTGGKKSGLHVIFPINFVEPILLGGRAITFNRYLARRKYHELLFDSAKDTFFALCLLFQQEYSTEPVVRQTTMHLRDLLERTHKLLFDIIAAPNKGRRALYSLHNNTGNICVPIRILPPTFKEAQLLTNLQFVSEHSKEYFEASTNWHADARTSNFYYLKQISQYSKPLLRDYYTLPRHQFTKKLFGDS